MYRFKVICIKDISKKDSKEGIDIIYHMCYWLRWLDSNQRFLAYETKRMTTSIHRYIFMLFLVRNKRIELLTSVESGQHSTSELTTLFHTPCGGLSMTIWTQQSKIVR